MYKHLILLVLLCPVLLFGQAQPPVAYQPQLITYPGTPQNPCQIYQVAENVATGQYYNCLVIGGQPNGTWQPLSSTLQSGLTGQVETSTNGVPQAPTSPSIVASISSPVSTTPYTIQCDDATTNFRLVDRGHTIHFKSGASVINVPLSTTTSGGVQTCAGLATTLYNDQTGGTLTVQRAAGSTDTFTVYTSPGTAPSTGQTSFTFQFGQTVTLAQESTGIWTARLSGGTSASSPLIGIYASANCAATQTRCIQLPQSGGILYDCSVSNSSSTVTCPDAVFSTSTMAVGMNMFGVCNPQLSGGGLNTTTSTLVVPYGTITQINSTTQVTVSTTSTAGCTASGNQGLIFGWGFPADSQFTTAWTAAVAAPDCSGLNVDAGVWFLTAPNFNSSTNACKLGVGIMRTGPSFTGQGMNSTILVVTPSLSLSSCTNGTSGAACFFTSGGVQLMNFQMTGLYNPIGGSNIKHLVELNSATTANTTTQVFNVSIAGWGGTSTNTVCLDVNTNTPEPLFTGLAVQGCYWDLQLDGTSTGGFLTDGFIEDCNNACVRINGSNDLITYATVMGPVMDNGGSGSTVILQGNNAFWEDWGGVLDFANSQGSNQHTLLTLNGTGDSAYLHNTLFQPNSTATFATINQNSTGGYILLDHAQVTSGSAASGIACNSSTTNKYAVTNGTKFFGGPGVNANCVAANFVDPSGIIQAGAQTAGTAVNFGTAISTTALVAASTTTGFLISSPIHVSFNTRQVTAGVGCGAGSNTVTPSITYTSPGGTAQTINPTVLTISANGSVDSLAVANGQDYYITVKAGTALNYSTTSTLASAGCSTTPQYAVDVRVL